MAELSFDCIGISAQPYSAAPALDIRLRISETRRLFGFPDDFTLAGSRRSVQAQLGNSVPPPLAELVVRALTQEAP